MKRSVVIILSIFALLLIIGIVYLMYALDKGRTSPEDIVIKAVLKPNQNETMGHKDVMLEIVIEKKNYSNHMVYPYSPKLHYLSFAENEEEGFFRPTNVVALSGLDRQKVYDTLLEHRMIDGSVKEEEISTIGFWSPYEAGEHQMRVYFEANDFTASDPLYIVYVHDETGLFGKDLSWTKLIKVKIELNEALLH